MFTMFRAEASNDRPAAEAAMLREPLGPATRRVHPLKAWRMTQLVDAGPRERRMMTVSDACRLYSEFVGRTVLPQTWHGWERYDDEPGHRKPDTANQEGLFLFTRGAMRPDHFHPIGEWRRKLAKLLEDEAAAKAAPAGGGGGERGASPSAHVEAQDGG
jgi:hypothetical protein